MRDVGGESMASRESRGLGGKVAVVIDDDKDGFVHGVAYRPRNLRLR
jgi:hypothetical protein